MNKADTSLTPHLKQSITPDTALLSFMQRFRDPLLPFPPKMLMKQIKY